MEGREFHVETPVEVASQSELASTRDKPDGPERGATTREGRAEVLLQLGVFRFGLLQNRDVRVGVLP